MTIKQFKQLNIFLAESGNHDETVETGLPFHEVVFDKDFTMADLEGMVLCLNETHKGVAVVVRPERKNRSDIYGADVFVSVLEGATDAVMDGVVKWFEAAGNRIDPLHVTISVVAPFPYHLGNSPEQFSAVLNFYLPRFSKRDLSNLIAKHVKFTNGVFAHDKTHINEFMTAIYENLRSFKPEQGGDPYTLTLKSTQGLAVIIRQSRATDTPVE